MTKKNQSLLLLLLFVSLLVVISTRVAPKAASQKEQDTEELPAATAEPVQEPVATPEEPEPPKQGRDLFPEASLSDWNLQLVNGIYVLPSTFAPNVVQIRDGQYIDARIQEPLESMLNAAEQAGFTVCVKNAYRPYSTQAYIFNGRASQIQWGTTMTLLEAETEARKVVAYPGTSEHQLGLCVDIMDNSTTSMAADEARSIPVLQWLRSHCAEYGFILRYPENKEELTGWDEPWHFRYVGPEIAAYVMENGLCLEEFIEQF